MTRSGWPLLLKRKLLFAGSIVALLLVGCVDLEEVTDLAKAAEEARTSLPVLASDFEGSCTRQNLYVHAAAPPAPASPKACVSGEDLEALGKNLIVEQRVLLDYFSALGKLATHKPLSYGKSASLIGTSFKDGTLSESQGKLASSAGKLAAALEDMAVRGYRKREVSKRVQESDPDIQVLTKGLSDQIAGSASTSYLSLLANEELLMDSYYKIPLARELLLEQSASEAPERPGGTQTWQPSPEPLGAMLISRQYESDQYRLGRHREAAAAYQLLMSKLATAHAKLAADTKNNHFDGKQLARDIGPDVTAARDAVTELQKNLR